MAKKNASSGSTPAEKKEYTHRNWMRPRKRAEGYASEKRDKVHKFGKRKGEELTEYDHGVRSGYLLCQTDHAGAYKYKKAINEGKTKEEAAEISRVIRRKK